MPEKALGKTRNGSIFTVNAIGTSLFWAIRSATIKANSRGISMRSFSLLAAATASLVLASTNAHAADLTVSGKILAGAAQFSPRQDAHYQDDSQDATPPL